MRALFLAVFLAQAVDFVMLKVCYLDMRGSSWESRPDPQGRELFIRSDQVLLIKPMPPNVVGVACSKICTAHGCQYVVGSIQEIAVLFGGLDE